MTINLGAIHKLHNTLGGGGGVHIYYILLRLFNKNPSCIDLIVTDQPNIVLDSGTCPSLDPFCHDQITHCKINFRLPPPPPYDRKLWHFNQAMKQCT